MESCLRIQQPLHNGSRAKRLEYVLGICQDMSIVSHGGFAFQVEFGVRYKGLFVLGILLAGGP